MMSKKRILNLRVLGVDVKVECGDENIFQLFRLNYSAFVKELDSYELHYVAAAAENAIGYELNTYELKPERLTDERDLLYFFEKDIELNLQRAHSELYFIHGAALNYKGRGCLIIAPSGSGKSTLTWALVNRGFIYLSDELAPIDLSTHEVIAYPHALCLKSLPPAPFTLPEGTVSTPATWHVPVEQIPAGYQRESCIVTAIYFVQYQATQVQPAIKAISPAAAAARVYANALNQLAHSGQGLPAAAAICARVKSYEIVTTSDLSASVELVKDSLEV